MKIINPKFTDTVTEFAKNKATAVETYLISNNDQSEITFDKIRADFAGVKDPRTGEAPMTDGTLAEIFQYLGYETRE